VGGQHQLYPRKRPGTHCTEGWVGPRAGLDVCEKSRPNWDSMPGPSGPYRELFPWGTRDRGLKLTPPLHVMQTLRTRGVIPLLSLYTAMAQKGTALPRITAVNTLATFQHVTKLSPTVRHSGIQRMQILAVTQSLFLGNHKAGSITLSLGPMPFSCHHPAIHTGQGNLRLVCF
jgi:hypothetical protein